MLIKRSWIEEGSLIELRLAQGSMQVYELQDCNVFAEVRCFMKALESFARQTWHASLIQLAVNTTRCAHFESGYDVE